MLFLKYTTDINLEQLQEISFLTKNASLQKHYNEPDHVFLITNTPKSTQLPYFCTMRIANALSVGKKNEKFLKIILNN